MRGIKSIGLVILLTVSASADTPRRPAVTTQPATGWRSSGEAIEASRRVESAKKSLETARAAVSDRVKNDDRLKSLRAAEADAKAALEKARSSGDVRDRLDAGAAYNRAKQAADTREGEVADPRHEVAVATETYDMAQRAEAAAHEAYRERIVSTQVEGMRPETAARVRSILLRGNYPSPDQLDQIHSDMPWPTPKGAIGKLAGVHVVRVVDPKSFLIDVRIDRVVHTLLVSGVSTEGFVDDEVTNIPGAFRCQGITTRGGAGTVPLIEAVNVRDVFQIPD